MLFLSFAILLKSIDSCAGRDEPWPSTSDVITFDQNWHHLYSTSAGGKDLSNHTQIRVLSLMAPEICTKSWVKNSEQNFLPLHVASPWYNLLILMTLFLKSASEPIRRPITAAKRKEKGEKEK